MLDLLYLTHNRLEFTRASIASVIAHTAWSFVRKVVLYDDRSTDGTREFLNTLSFPVPHEIVDVHFHSPVAVMNHYLDNAPAEMFAKIDNDVIVPAGWLVDCLTLLIANPRVEFLGIEAQHPVALSGPRKIEPTRYIGGIGVMCTRAFGGHDRPQAQGRFGFTAWQDQNPQVSKAWINPALPVCLLDRLNFEPWKSLSQQYVAMKWQRPWQPYDDCQHELWDWWAKAEAVPA